MEGERKILDSDNNTFKIVESDSYMFAPQKDITLKNIVDFLQLAQLKVDDTFYGKLPVEIQKHFTKGKEQ